MDWEEVRARANEVSRWVPMKNERDRRLILAASILAQGLLPGEWLQEALSAVRRKAGPLNAAAFFRGCLVRGLGELLGPRPKEELQTLYRHLEKLAPVPDWPIRQRPAGRQEDEQEDVEPDAAAEALVESWSAELERNRARQKKIEARRQGRNAS